jgi:PAS domain S-box-containing protein
VREVCLRVSAILDCPDLETTAGEIMKACRELLGPAQVAVAFLTGDPAPPAVARLGAGGRPRRLGAAPPAQARALRALAAAPARGFVENGRPRRGDLPFPPSARLSSLLVAPMRLHGAAAGLILLGDKPGGFTEADLLLAESFGSAAAAAHQRCTATETLERSEERFHGIFARSPIGVAVFGADGRPAEANRAFLEIFGLRRLEQLQGLQLLDAPLFTPARRARLRAGKTLRLETPLDFDTVRRRIGLRTTRSGRAHLDVLVTPFGAAGRAPASFLVHVQDASPLHRFAADLQAAKATLVQRVARATRALTRSNAALRARVAAHAEAKRLLRAEKAFRVAVENSLLVGIVVADRRGRVLEVNRAFCALVGWPRRSLLGKTPPYPWWPPGEEAQRLAYYRRLFRGRLPEGGIWTRMQRRGGESFDARVMLSRVHDRAGKAIALVASVTDVTQQQRTEAALRESAAQLKRLSARLLVAEERERARIARELHDSLGQTLTALKYRIEEAAGLCLACPGTHSAVKKLEATGTLLAGAIAEVRSIVMDLRPSVLDDLGLAAAIRWFCRQFRETHPGIRLALRIRLDGRPVREELRVPVFRLLQEALTNAGKHAGGERISVELRRGAGRLHLRVGDNGRGFVPQERSLGMGLLGMRERSELSGGVFAVASAPGRGTVVRASWPL